MTLYLVSSFVLSNRNAIGKDDIDMNELEQVQKQQSLAKQQQELMELIAKTETLFANIESDAALSVSDITGVTDQMKQWSNVLETLEEKETRKRKEKEAKERKKRESEENEKRKKENEERKEREKKNERGEKKKKQRKRKNEKRKRQNGKKKNKKSEKK